MVKRIAAHPPLKFLLTSNHVQMCYLERKQCVSESEFDDSTPNSPKMLNHDRTSSLEEIFLDPGFFWSWERFVDRWTSLFGFPEDIIALTYVDVIENYNSLVCSNLKNFKKDKQFIKVR